MERSKKKVDEEVEREGRQVHTDFHRELATARNGRAGKEFRGEKAQRNTFTLQL